ncbi:hypothetical protein AAEO56_18970 [Flavobacterium sp. DGU11]|uniref:GIY-YIG domain-containing protein n=1 Tax=Flavobacterium arundinis TaxID=3139143 RepID=A0ABU9I1R3_9FLAO
MFDEKTKQELKYYVYMLLDPQYNKPFYIGKGKDDRVFSHLACALTEEDISNAKYEKIREINLSGQIPTHVIIRHGLSESEAYQIEASLIDTLSHCGMLLLNKVGGHNSMEKGLMSCDEITRLYNAEPINSIMPNCILININGQYKRGIDRKSIYDATKEIWAIKKDKIPHLKYVLSEYKGLIVEVYEVNNWYEKERGYMPTSKRFGQTRIGYGFNGNIAPEEIRNQYINKSVAHTKKKGSANPVRYNL